MIRQWNLSREGYPGSGVFTPTPGDYHLFICSHGTSFTYLEALMKKHNIPKENIVYKSIDCRNDVHPGSSRNTLYIIKT